MGEGTSWLLSIGVTSAVTMLSVDQSYSRLFRPWDASESAKNVDLQKTSLPTVRQDLQKNTVDARRESRLRKIRGHYKKQNLDQDSTISTTTVEESTSSSLESPVASLTECCDRLLQDPSSKSAKKTLKPKKIEEPPKMTKKIVEDPRTPKKIREEIPTLEDPRTLYSIPPPMPLPQPDLLQFPADIYSGFAPELLPPAELAHALGIAPTDPLLLESLAQGYAMELEYARILHQENQAKLLNARKQRPKKYKCPHCQVGFSNNGQLKGHIRIHTGERPFKCDDKNCGKTFTRNEELTRHKRIHSGLRPYACPSCGKKFGRRDHLKKHTRTHLMQAERMMPVFLPLSAVPHGSFPYLYGY